MNRFLNIDVVRRDFPESPEWNGPAWFNLGVGSFSIGVLIPERFYRSFPVWPYNAFRRVYDNPRHNCWGFGLLQIGGRHLLGIVLNEEVFKVDVAFLHLVHVERDAESSRAAEGDSK